MMMSCLVGNGASLGSGGMVEILRLEGGSTLEARILQKIVREPSELAYHLALLASTGRTQHVKPTFPSS